MLIILCENVNNINRNTGALSEATRDTCLEITTEETKHVVVSLHQRAGQDRNLLIAKKYSENLAKYSGITVTNQIFIHDEIKNGLNSKNVTKC
jgi:hypothetical protein